MRVFTFLLFFLTVVAGYLSYNGVGSMTEMAKLTYAYFALSTVVSALIAATTRSGVRDVAARNVHRS